MLAVDLPERVIARRLDEIAVQLLAVFNPFRAENFERIGLVRVILRQEADRREMRMLQIGFLEVFRVEDVLMLVLHVLDWLRQEGLLVELGDSFLI